MCTVLPGVGPIRAVRIASPLLKMKSTAFGFVPRGMISVVHISVLIMLPCVNNFGLRKMLLRYVVSRIPVHGLSSSLKAKWVDVCACMVDILRAVGAGDQPEG